MPLSSRRMPALVRRLKEAAGGCCEPPGVAAREKDPESGSAVVEFTFLALLLMVPLVYFIVTMGQIQGGTFAVVGAADQAAKVFVTYEDPGAAIVAAEQAAVLTLADFGHEASRAEVVATCEPGDCSTAGSAVTVKVTLAIDLPLVPFGRLGVHATEVDASATQLIGRFR